MTLTETGVNTGIFQGSLLTADADGPHHRKLRAPGEDHRDLGVSARRLRRFRYGTGPGGHVRASRRERESTETLLAGARRRSGCSLRPTNTSSSSPNALPAEFLTPRQPRTARPRLRGRHETGPDTGLFVGTVQTRFNYPSYMDGTVQILSGDLGRPQLQPRAAGRDGRRRPRPGRDAGLDHPSDQCRAGSSKASAWALAGPASGGVHGAGDPGSPDQEQAWIWSEATDDFRDRDSHREARTPGFSKPDRDRPGIQHAG